MKLMEVGGEVESTGHITAGDTAKLRAVQGVHQGNSWVQLTGWQVRNTFRKKYIYNHGKKKKKKEIPLEQGSIRTPTSLRTTVAQGICSLGWAGMGEPRQKGMQKPKRQQRLR